MNKEFYISNNGICPEELEGKKITRIKNINDLVVRKYFENELFGPESILVNYWAEKTIKVNYGRPENIENISRMSFLQRKLFINKTKNNIKKSEQKEKEIKEKMTSIKQAASVIVEFCSIYGLNVDGSYKDNSKYEKTLFQLSKVADANVNKMFVEQMNIVRSEVQQSYQLLKHNIHYLSSHCVYTKRGSIIFEFSYDDLERIVDENQSLLDKMLNNMINKNIKSIDVLQSKENSFNFDDDFITESINKGKKNIPVFDEIEFLKKSKYLKENELNLLLYVENAYNEVAISENKLHYIKEILNTLGADQRFEKIKEELEKQEIKEKERCQKLLVDAQEKYDKYNIKSHVEIVQKQHANSVNQGNLLFAKKQAKNSENYNIITIEDNLRKSRSVGRELKKRSIMEQYLREKAFKTENGKLKFSQFVEKYAKIYELDTVEKENLINDMEISNGRRL